jgi:RluA family pseudouridine synthase
MSAESSRTQSTVLYEDAALLVVEKCSGVLSHPNPGKSDLAVAAAFEGRYMESERRFDTASGSLWLIHRLDEDTSGVLLAAKTHAAAEICRQAFEQDRVRKHYWALIRAAGLRKQGAWLDHLETRSTSGSVRTWVQKQRRPNAELHYRIISENSAQRLALVDIDLYTGRTHQIRVQAAARSHPVAGDDVYGDFAMNRELRRTLGLRRLFLHAWKLEMLHPVSKKKLSFVSQLPADLKEVSAALGLHVGLT